MLQGREFELRLHDSAFGPHDAALVAIEDGHGECQPDAPGCRDFRSVRAVVLDRDGVVEDRSIVDAVGPLKLELGVRP